MKGKINFIIDALMFILLAAITGLGLLMKYVLIPGKDRIAVFGRSVDLYFLGWDRHEWGGLHLILGFLMLGLLVLHIVLHWKAIQCLFRCLINTVKLRKLIVLGFSLISLFLFLFPFIVRIEIQDVKSGSHSHHHISEHPSFETLGDDGESPVQTTSGKHETAGQMHASIHVQGRMTLAQVSAEYHVPVSVILSELDIHDPVSPNAQLGHLRRQYGFRMSQVENFIQQHNKPHLR